MVQSENQAAGQGGAGGGGKKKNRRNRNKNKKNQQQSDEPKVEIEVAAPEQPAPAKPAGSRSASESSSEIVPPPAVVAPVTKASKPDPKKEAEVKPLVDLLRNLAQDFMPYNLSELNDAERSFYESKPAEAEEDLDLFASDEEPQEKPKMVKPQSKVPPKQQQQQQAKKKQTKAPKAKGDSDAASQPVTSAVQNPKNGERTFIMLKPDAVQRKLVGEIIGRFESRGFKLVALKFMHASRALLERHYADLSKKPFFPELIRYMSSGPVVPMVWEGLNVVKTGRVMLGETNPQNSAPGTIRGDYCIDVGRNIIHGSDSLDSAAKEIAMWFGNVSDWRPAAVSWIYEDEEDETAAPVVVQAVDGLAAMAGGVSPDVANKLATLEKEGKEMKKVISDLKNLVITLQGRIESLEKGGSTKPAAAAAAPVADDDDDDDVDLFGSDDEEEDAEKERIKAERVKAYQEKKSKKPQVIAKTSVLLDVKPWDDETDMDAMLKAVKSIEKDGLVWGASKLVPVGYGINKLQILCVVEDEKVSIEELCEQITEFEDYVQNADVSSMQKI